jgi:hypothetical protein
MKRRVAPHGTTTRYYTYKCRCTRCRKAAREYMQTLRARLRNPETVARKIPHGTVNGYENYGCRCERCTKAKMKSKRAARKKAAAAA